MNVFEPRDQECIPAARTGAIDSLSRDARNDMRNGIKLIELIALSALFDVSLEIMSPACSNNALKKPTTNTKVS